MFQVRIDMQYTRMQPNTYFVFKYFKVKVNY